MELIDYSIKWLDGEICSGKWALAFGVLLAIVGAILWKTGESPNAKALIIPAFVCALLVGGTGGGMVWAGIERKTEFRSEYDRSPEEFLQKETARNAASVKVYPWSPVVCSALFLGAILISALSASPTVRSWCIAAMFIAFALTVTDFFSRENGEQYQNELKLFQQQ